MSNKVILIIEDDKKVFEMINSCVSQFGSVVHERAVDGAIGALEEYDSFDLVIVDLKILAQGLNLEQMVLYRDMEGLGFLKEYYWEKAPNEEEKSRRKATTIICSRYTEDLRSEFPDDAKSLVLISKESGFVGKLQARVRKLLSD